MQSFKTDFELCTLYFQYSTVALIFANLDVITSVGLSHDPARSGVVFLIRLAASDWMGTELIGRDSLNYF